MDLKWQIHNCPFLGSFCKGSSAVEVVVNCCPARTKQANWKIKLKIENCKLQIPKQGRNPKCSGGSTTSFRTKSGTFQKEMKITWNKSQKKENSNIFKKIETLRNRSETFRKNSVCHSLLRGHYEWWDWCSQWSEMQSVSLSLSLSLCFWSGLLIWYDQMSDRLQYKSTNRSLKVFDFLPLSRAMHFEINSGSVGESILLELLSSNPILRHVSTVSLSVPVWDK